MRAAIPPRDAAIIGPLGGPTCGSGGGLFEFNLQAIEERRTALAYSGDSSFNIASLGYRNVLVHRHWEIRHGVNDVSHMCIPPADRVGQRELDARSCRNRNRSIGGSRFRLDRRGLLPRLGKQLPAARWRFLGQERQRA